MNILVLGASGNVGSHLSHILTEQGHTVLKATSQEPKSPEQIHLNLLTGEGVSDALGKADAAFLLAPPGYVNQDELLNPVIDQAKAHGVKKVVLMTAMGANVDERTPFRKAEIHLEKSGLDYNIIRPNWFMQNFHTFWIQGILEQNTIFLPTGQAKGSFIDARDIASVAAKLLTSDTHKNQDFDLTGSEALDHNEVADILSKVTGKPITYEDISPGVMQEQLIAAGLPKDYVGFLGIILDAFKQGYAESVTPAVETITGQAPIRFEKYAQDHKSAWL